MLKLYLHDRKDTIPYVSVNKEVHWVENIAKRPLLDKPLLRYHSTIGAMLVEDTKGSVVVECWGSTEYKPRKVYHVISSEVYKSRSSEWVKKFRIETDTKLMLLWLRLLHWATHKLQAAIKQVQRIVLHKRR